MTRRQWARWGVLVGILWASGCNGGGTQPPGPPTDLVPTGGDRQNWFFNNPLPTVLSVTAVDIDGRAVPGVIVTWAVTSSSGSGAVSPTQSTTNAIGVATTTDSVGSSTTQTVSATFSGLIAAVAPCVAARLMNFAFSPKNSVVQTGGTVTWTWNDGTAVHTLNFNATDPTPRPADTPQQATGSVTFTFTTVGTYSFFCAIHQAQGMTGQLTVVH